MRWSLTCRASALRSSASSEAGDCVVDINDFRSILTVLGLLCFLGIVAWAYSSRAKKGFDEAAQLPFADEDMPDRDVGHRKEGTKNG